MRVLKNYIIIASLLFAFESYAQNDSTKVTFNGQVTAWAVGQADRPNFFQLGGRFVPTILGKLPLSTQLHLDFEVSATMNGSVNSTKLQFDTVIGQLKPYRVWSRILGTNWEVRAGLQKINFGQAKMLRPLMWFDAMDVRDPLQLTDGVYSVLGKYFFENNANVWLWGLVGNKNPKGFEMFGSAKWKPEMGGRFQTPLGSGELALSTNFRKMIVPDLASSIPNHNFELNESRVGLDGKWDIGIGLWFESSLTYTDKKNYLIPITQRFQDMWNVGADYTFPVGNGVGMTLEYFRYHAGDSFLIDGNALDVLGTLLNYPLNLLDNLSGMVFYLPEQKKWMSYLNWSRTYDNLSIYAILYLNPTGMQLLSNEAVSAGLFAGRGIQLMVNYNF